MRRSYEELKHSQDLLVRQEKLASLGRLAVVLQVLSIGFFGLLVIHGIPLVERSMRQLSSAIRIPMGYIYMSIPVGSALILLFAVERLIRIGEKGPEGAITV